MALGRPPWVPDFQVDRPGRACLLHRRLFRRHVAHITLHVKPRCPGVPREDPQAVCPFPRRAAALGTPSPLSFTPTKYPPKQTSRRSREVVRGGLGGQRTDHNAHTHTEHHTSLLYHGASAGNKTTAAGAQRRGQAGACSYISSLHALAGIQHPSAPPARLVP